MRSAHRIPFPLNYDLRADMEEPNNDIDTETLQAQIDLAMAHTQSLIASWLPAPSGSLTQSPSSSRAAETEAELQALLRRPPRYVAPPSSLFYFAARETSIPSPFIISGLASVRHSRKLMPPPRHVSYRSYRAVKSTAGRRRTVRTQTYWV